MSRQRFILLLIAAALAISAAVYFNARRDRPRETQGVALLPALAGEMSSVTAVIIDKGASPPAVTLHRTGTQWTVAERGDYPADVAKLRKLMSALVDAKIVEQKTSDPARYASIGVEDPSKPGATGAEVAVLAPAGKLAVIVGKPVGEGNFVRLAGAQQSYSVEPGISVETEPRFWIDSRLIDVPAALIQSIEVKPATGAAYTLHRQGPDNAFSIEGVPAGRKALDGPALAPAPSMLAGLDAEDVSPAAAIDFKQSSQVTLTLTDGNVLTLTGVAVGDQHWIEVAATKDSALTAKTRERAFQLASYRYDAIFRPLEQLLVPKESPATKAPAVPRGPAAAASHAAKKPAPAAPVQAAPTPAAPPS